MIDPSAIQLAIGLALVGVIALTMGMLIGRGLVALWRKRR